MVQFMQHRSFCQSFFGEVSPVLEVDSDISVAHSSTVKNYPHSSYAVVLS